MLVYHQLFTQYFGVLPQAQPDGELVISSPFRSDSTPSLHINLETGQYNDFGSELKGDAYKLYMDMHGVDFVTAKTNVEACLANKPWVHPIDIAYVEDWHDTLMKDLPKRAYLTSQRGLSLETVKKFQIGFNKSDNRYTIPIFNQYGICINIRRYDPTGTGMGKMIPYRGENDDMKGWGSNQLFPLEALASETIVLHEGEWDTLLQWSKGIPAITCTAGAGSWKSEWTHWFQGKTVYICYDADTAGQKGATKVAAYLHPVAKGVYIIDLPLSGTKEDKDITDYYLKHQKTSDDFKALMANAKPYEPSISDVDAFSHTETVPLATARQASFKNKRVKFDVRVVGKNTAPYNIPIRGSMKCDACGMNEKLCERCGIASSGGEVIVQVPVNPDMLSLIKTSKQALSSFVKDQANVPNNCKAWRWDEDESINVEEVLLAPEIPDVVDDVNDSGEYLVQTAYFAGPPIEANRSYSFEGVMTPDPWQQNVTFLLDTMEPLQDTVETFALTPSVRQQLEIFQVGKGQTLEEKFLEIHEDFEANVTHIVGRKDLLTGIDLVYHSVLAFNFQGVRVGKGWLEFLCLGDTRTGKSETTEAMLKHYRLGEASVAENTSYAGLVGGLQQTGDKRWFLTWGKLPLNDGRLFIIDEASGMSQEDISRMSGIRSSGIAEITKIQTERTTARTRLIWLSNPRSGRHLGEYSHGIQAVRELIGKAEDISRFDFVVTAAKGEVPIELINRVIDPTEVTPHKYTSQLCKTLVLWAWSRKVEDIEFEHEAVKLILSYAISMGEEYSARIPLVEAANQRIKLARMAVATAARVYSTDETGEKVIVKKEHVEFSHNFLQEIYSKPSMNYKGFSSGERLDAQAAMKNRTLVFGFLQSVVGLADLCIRQDYINSRTVEEQLNVDRSTASEIISNLSKWRMITDSGAKGYRKTPGFIAMLREWESD